MGTEVYDHFGKVIHDSQESYLQLNFYQDFFKKSCVQPSKSIVPKFFETVCNTKICFNRVLFLFGVLKLGLELLLFL